MTLLHEACAFQEISGKFELLIPSTRHSLIGLAGDELGKEDCCRESWGRKHFRQHRLCLLGVQPDPAPVQKRARQKQVSQVLEP